MINDNSYRIYILSPINTMSIEDNGNTVPGDINHIFRTFRRTLEGNGYPGDPEITVRKKRRIRGHGDVLGHCDKATGEVDIKRGSPHQEREALVHELVHIHWPDATEEDVTTSAERMHARLGPRRRAYLDDVLKNSY